MKRHLIPFLAALAAAQPAWALRCGQSLVVEGDEKYQVLKRCGNPDFTDSRIEYRTVGVRGSSIHQPGLDTITTVPVIVEDWTYDFGPNRFVEVVSFEQGRVIRIQTRGYGD